MKTFAAGKHDWNGKRFCRYLFGLVLLLPCTAVIFAASASGQEATQEPTISLQAQNQPLAEVLNKIGRDTGYEFKVNEQWKDYPVRASITNLPLSQGLKRILANLNHAIIYEAGQKIKIIVYGKVDSQKNVSGFVPPPSVPATEPQEESASGSEEPEDTRIESAPDDAANEEADSAESAERESDPANQSDNLDEQAPEDSTPENESPESAPEQN